MGAVLLNVNQRFARLLVAQRNAVMVLMLRDHLVLTDRWRMHGNAFSPVAHFDGGSTILNPDLFASVNPGYRVAAALPGYVGIARHLALLFIYVRVGRPSVDRLHCKLVCIPPHQHLFVSGPMDTLVSNLRYPAAQLAVQIRETRGLTPLQPTQGSCAGYTLTPDSTFPFVCARYGRQSRGVNPQ